MEIEKRYYLTREVCGILNVPYSTVSVTSKHSGIGHIGDDGKKRFTKKDIQKLKQLL